MLSGSAVQGAMKKRERTPVRSCVACRTRRPQRELLRVVLTDKGPLLDPGRKRQGRGSYICPDKPGCWEEKKLRRFAGAHAKDLAEALALLFSKEAPNTKVIVEGGQNG
ncbi:MAG: YlxR family protein [Deinococcus sp.]|nr:YlxR family protein [Deinococcus sp.]MCL5964648.1 YlxR family protein [Deinococcus sp.]